MCELLRYSYSKADGPGSGMSRGDGDRVIADPSSL